LIIFENYDKVEIIKKINGIDFLQPRYTTQKLNFWVMRMNL